MTRKPIDLNASSEDAKKAKGGKDGIDKDNVLDLETGKSSLSAIENANKGKCLTESGNSIISYQTKTLKDGTEIVMIEQYDGGGTFDNFQVSMQKVKEILGHAGSTFTSAVVAPLFRNRNNKAFMMKVLVDMGLIEPVPDRRHWYRRKLPELQLLSA